MKIQYNGYTFVISERKNPGNKPKLFLMMKEPRQQYISSLFPEGDGIYRLDYEGRYTRVNLNSSLETIGKTLSSSISPYNNMELVRNFRYTPPENEPTETA